MSEFDEIRLYCEDEERRPTVRLLFLQMAAARRWTDLLRATLVDLRWRVSRAEWTSTDAHLTSRDEALAELSSRFAETKAAIETALQEPDARTKFESLEKDFAADGPLVHRVDSKGCSRRLTSTSSRMERDARAGCSKRC